MSLINTGSWYQVLLRRPKNEVIKPFAPIIDFNIESDFLNFRAILSAEYLEPKIKIFLLVQNLVVEQSRVILSAIHMENNFTAIFNVDNIQLMTKIHLSAANID